MNGLQIQKCDLEKTEKKNMFFCIVLSLLLVWGYVGMFVASFETLIPYMWMYLGFAVCLSVLYIAFCPQKWKNKGLLLCCGILLLLFLAFFEKSKAGIYFYGNEIRRFITGKFGIICFDYLIEDDSGVYYITALLSAFLSIILTASSCFGKKCTPIILFFLFGIGTVFDFFKGTYHWALVVAGFLLLLLHGNLRKAKESFEYKSIFFAGSIVGICLLVSMGMTAMVEVNTKQEVKNLKRKIHESMYHSENHAMPEGDLHNLSRFIKNQQEAYVITVEKPQKFYFRGMVGEVYTGSSWEPFGEEVRTNNEELFYWLHKSNFFGNNSISKASILFGNDKEHKMTITNVGGCKSRQILPYGLSGSNGLDEKQIGDGTMPAKAETDTYTYTEGSIPRWYAAAMYLAENQSKTEVQHYLQLEQNYRKFVYENDLQITGSVVAVCENLFRTENQERTLSEILDLIRATLRDQLVYNDMINTYNGNNDFFQYTMEQSKEGYSVHYATAATLLLRYFGIPARYVEGYFLSTEQAGMYKAGEEILLTEANAHAWTEVYLDGIGWIPFEVTPGYIDEDEQLEAFGVLADGLGLEKGKTYQENPLKYAAPPNPKEDLQTPDINSHFRFSVQWIYRFGLVLLCALLFGIVIWIVLRKRRLDKFWHMVEQSDHKQAILYLYGYAVMLADKCNHTKGADWEAVRQINEEAMFSAHEMKDRQRQQVYLFVRNIINQCKKENSMFKNMRYHYILWLYK